MAQILKSFLLVNHDPCGLALDGAENKMYWTDQGTNMIRRADLDGANIKDLAKALRTPVGLALDVVGGKMYWTTRTRV